MSNQEFRLQNSVNVCIGRTDELGKYEVKTCQGRLAYTGILPGHFQLLVGTNLQDPPLAKPITEAQSIFIQDLQENVLTIAVPEEGTLDLEIEIFSREDGTYTGRVATPKSSWSLFE